MNPIYQKSGLRLAVVSATYLAFFATAPINQTYAQSSAVLEETIVTARKREENLVDIPESVSAISGTSIDRQNIKGLNKIGLAVPNLNLSMRTDGYPNVTIRGIGAFGMTQGVGFYLDDVQLYGDASSRFGDLSRIEIMKGPQGVLYGGSNIGGAIKYVSERPSADEMSGRIKVLAGEQNVVDTEAAINVPLGDGWAMRAFGFYREDDGFMTNPNSPSPAFGVQYNQPKDVTAYDEMGGRISIAGDVSDTFSVYASFRYNEYDGPVNQWARETGTEPNYNYPMVLDTNRNSTHERETWGAHLELKWELENFDITSITSHTDTESTRITDVDLTQLWFFHTERPETLEVTTQEFRFTSNDDGDLQWQAGLYFTDYAETMFSSLHLGWLILEADDPFLDVPVPFESRHDDRSHRAAFGNFTYDMGEWEIGAGLRVDRWESEEVSFDVCDEATGVCSNDSMSKSDTEVLPRFSIKRDIEDGIIYATVSKGYEPGGWNGVTSGGPPVYDANGNRTLTSYDKEQALQIEAGMKREFMDGRANASVAVFHTKYESRQYEFIVPNPNGDGTLIDGITNVGDSTQMGIEISAALQATEHLVLTAAYGMIDAEWDSGTSVTIDGVPYDLSDVEPSQIVGNSASFTASFQMPMANGFDMLADLQVSHNGEMDGGKPWDVVRHPSYTVVDLQVGVTNGPWELMLNVENLTDEEYYTDLEPFDNFSLAGLSGEEGRIIIGTHGHPRIFSASVSYSF